MLKLRLPTIALGWALFAVLPAIAQTVIPDTLEPKHCVLPGEDRIVPNILGYEPAAAQKIIEACGFVWDGATDVHTMSYEAIGTVGDQEPGGGTLRKAKTTVRGFISTGMFAPDFSNWKDAKNAWSKSAAEQYIKDLRHGVVVEEKRHEAPVGIVFDQKPKNAEKYNSGQAIVISVSLGLFVDLPNFDKMAYGDAVNQLNSLKLIPAHGGGDLSSGSKNITICERVIWYPVVERTEPTGRVYESNTVRIFTRRANLYVLDPPPPGKMCP